MKKINILFSAIVAFAFLTSCAEETFSFVSEDVEMPVRISSTYPVAGVQTRADDNGFVADDEVGIFIVDYDKDGTPGELKMKGIRAANALFEYNGSTWDAPYQIYWADKATPADFYGYYPYDSAMETPTAYSFSVNSLQDSGDANSTAGAGYEESDLLWAKAEKVSPTTETINLQYRHLMAGITVSLEMGEGFTADEWNALNKTVLIGKTRLSGTVNFQDGSLAVGEDNEGLITPLSYNGQWRAVVMPQTISAGKELLIVDVGGQSYSLVKDVEMIYYSGRMHNFTLAVNKRIADGDYEFELLSDDVVAWIEDPDFHDGIVREYIVVHVDEPGTLSSVLAEQGYEYDEIGALKITGTLNHADLNFIGEKLSGMTALNIRDITITGNASEKDCLAGIGGRLHSGNKGILAHIILPTSIKKIGDQALKNVGLVGRVDIPDGVEYIGVEAFTENNLTGEVKLPSSLKILRGGAFAFNNGLSGTIYFPEGLQEIGPRYYGGQDFAVFQGTNLSGPLVLPSSLVLYENLGFVGTTGTIVIPPKTTIVPDYVFEDSGCTKVEFHEGIVEIGYAAFAGADLSGELVLPPDLKYIGGNAFCETKISKVIFPESLKLLGDGLRNEEGVFADCVYLTGTVTLPENVARIPKGCFNRCYSITGVVIPENVELIEVNAFYGCSAIASIVSHAEVPPVICENAFHGVNKDNFTVEVPAGCVDAYRQAPGWCEFKRIAEYSDFVCRPAQANALNTVHTETLILNADGDWEVEHCPSWVTLSQTSGTGKTELRLTFSQMEQGAGNRLDTIKFVMPAENHRTSCQVAQYDYEYEEDGCLTLQSHSLGDGIDVVFVGDGFDGQAISDCSYLNLVKEQVEYFFGLEPYKSHREYFDVHVTFPLSQECGVNTMNTYVNNRFGTLYGYDGTICTSNQLITAVDDVLDYALEYSPLEQNKIAESLVVLVPNDDAYDGNTIYSGNATISICPPSGRPYPQDTRGVIQHEAGGHGFGKLADEEISYSNWVPVSLRQEIQNFHSRGWYQNIAVSSKFNEVPWADFIFDTRYSDNVDIYEGAYGYMRGVFRSESNSCMNYGIPYYNAISRLEIMKRIFSYAGENFTMDYFYANDTSEWGDTDGATRSGTSYSYFTGTSYGASNTHVAPACCDAKAVGDAVRSIRAELKTRYYDK